jgi:hypothetical protein
VNSIGRSPPGALGGE